MYEEIYASTPHPNTDPNPWIDWRGRRYRYEFINPKVRKRYIPRPQFLLQRRHTGNGILIEFRQNGPTRAKAIRLHNSLMKAPGPYNHARKVLRKWVNVYHPRPEA